MSFVRQVLPKPAGLSDDHADTKGQLALLERQNASLKLQNNALKRTLDGAGLAYELPSDDRRKRPKFNNVHCDQCRKDKKGCWPRDRVWPQKCTRCIHKGLECSEGRRTRSKAVRQLNDETTSSSKQRQFLLLSIIAETKRLAEVLDVDPLQTTSNDEHILWSRQIDIALELYELCKTLGTILLLTAARRDQTVFVRLLLASGIAIEGGFLEKDLERFLDHKWSGKAAAIWLETHQKDVVALEGEEASEILCADHGALKHFITVDAQDVITSLEAAKARKCFSLMTPLMSAIESGKFAAAQLLLKKGADPDAFAPRSPAQIASTAWLEFAEVLEVLMRDPDISSRTEPPVAVVAQYAIVQSHISITERMSNATGDVDDDNSETSTDDCDWSGASHPATCELPLCDWHTWQVTPLYYAIDASNAACVQVLLDAKCSMNKIDGRANKPIYLALSRGRVEVLEILLHADPDVLQEPASVGAALDNAAKSGQYSLAKWLIDHAAKICLHSGRRDGINIYIGDALHSAAFWGYTDIVDLLLNSPHTEDIRPTDNSVSIALRNAVMSGRQEIVRLLVQAGAWCNGDARDLLSLASSKGHVDIVKLLLSMLPTSFDLDRALLTANQAGHTAIVETLLFSRANAAACYEDNLSLLDVASCEGHLPIVRLLILGCENPSRYDWAGRALLLATQNDHTSVVKVLLEAGANSTASDEDGLAPLDIAAKDGHLDILDLLLEYGAALYGGSRSALRLAVRNGHTAIARSLLAHGASLGVRIGVKDNSSHELLLLAAKGRHMDIFCMLRDYGLCIDPDQPETNNVFSEVINDDQDQWVLEMLQAGVNPYMAWHRRTEQVHGEGEVSLLRLAVEKSWYSVVRYLYNHKVPREGLGEKSLVRLAIRERKFATAALLMPGAVAELEAELLDTLQLTRARYLAIQQEMIGYLDWIRTHVRLQAATLPRLGNHNLEALLEDFTQPVETVRVLSKEY